MATFSDLQLCAMQGHIKGYCCKCGMDLSKVTKEYPSANYCRKCITRMRVGNALLASKEARGVKVYGTREFKKCYPDTPRG